MTSTSTAPASDYVPALGDVQVLDGFDDAGQPVLRAPKSAITTKQLLLHTAGFGYDFFNPQYNRLATEHQRGEDGTLVPTEFQLPEPEVHMGGHGLHSTVGDYLRFLRMRLHDGASDSDEVVLKPETVRMAEAHDLGDLQVKMLPGLSPSLSNDAEFFPGMPKSWGYTFMVTDEDAPTGRPAGSLAWAGLANLYYWIDRRNGVAGFWGTQIFPFADAASVTGYLEMETAVYDALKG